VTRFISRHLIVVALIAMGCSSGGKLPSFASVGAVGDEMTKNGVACENIGPPH